MPGYRFWEWDDPDELNKKKAEDFVRDASRVHEESMLGQLQQHVGGILESVTGAGGRAWAASAPDAWRDGTERSRYYDDQAAREDARGGVLAPANKALLGANRAMEGINNLAMGGVLPLAGRFADELAGTPTVGQLAPAVNDIPIVGKALGESKPLEIASQVLPLPGKAGKLAAALGGTAKAEGMAARAGVLGAHEVASLGGLDNIAGGALLGAGAAGTAQILRPHDVNDEDEENPLRAGATAHDDALNPLIAGAVFGGTLHKTLPGLVGNKAVRGAAQQIIADSYGVGRMTPKGEKLFDPKKWSRDWFDDLGALKDVSDRLSDSLGRPLKDSEDAYQIMRLARASNEIGDGWFRQHVGRGLGQLEEISGSIPQGRADLSDYLRAKDAIDKAGGSPGLKFDRDFGGMNVDDAQRGIAEIQQRLGLDKFHALDGVAQQFWQLGDTLLDRKVKAGLISADQAVQLKQIYPHYMPIHVLDHLEEDAARMNGSVGKIGGGVNDIKKLTEAGTARAAEDPLEAYYRSSVRTAALASKNEAALALVDAAKQNPLIMSLMRPGDNVSRQLLGEATGAATARRPGEMPLVFRVDGVPTKMYVDKSLEPLISFGTSQGEDFFRTWGGRAANVVRGAAIGYNPVWGVGQFVMDSLTFLMKEGGFLDPSLGRNAERLGTGLVEAGKEFGKNLGLRKEGSALFNEAQRAGALPGAVDRASGKPGSYEAAVTKLTGQEVGSPGELAKAIYRWSKTAIKGVNETLDAAPRLAEYQRVLAEGGTVGNAAMAARDVTIDPSRGGSIARQINAVVPFFNVAFQGAAYAPRLLTSKDEKVRTKAMLGITSSVIAPAAALEHWNQQDPRYADVPDFDKNRGLVVMLPQGGDDIDPTTGEARPHYLLIRTGPFTPFAILGRAMYNAGAGNDVDLAKTGLGILGSSSPVDVATPLEAVSHGANPLDAAGKGALALTPTMFRVPLEAGFNYDTFRDRKIVPESLTHLPTDQQYTSQTSDVAKLIGGQVGVAPAQIDYLLKAWGGGADAATAIADGALHLTGIAQKGESQRVQKILRELAKTGLDDDKRSVLEGELEREHAIEKDREESLRNFPVLGGLAARYYRTQGGQRLEDKNYDLDARIKAKKGATDDVSKEMARLGKDFTDVEDSVGGVKLTRAQATTYREGAVRNREVLLKTLLAQPFYADADDKEKSRLVSEVMERGAAWASQDAIPGRNKVGKEWTTDAVGGDLTVATRGYMAALDADRQIKDIRENESLIGVKGDEYRQIASDKNQLAMLRSAFGEGRGDGIFIANNGSQRYARARMTKENPLYEQKLAQIKRLHPEHLLYIGTEPTTMTRSGLDANLVAQLR